MATVPPSFAPEMVHGRLLDTAPRLLAFEKHTGDFPGWVAQVRATFLTLLGDLPQSVEPNVRVEFEQATDAFIERRVVFTAEEGAEVPCHLLLPRGAGPFPLVICLQGHSTGMHISLGRPKYPGDEECIAGGRDFALQAVREGYAALALEQRCFGERGDGRPSEVRCINHGCHHATMTALLLGRTMIGERVWDIARAIDAMAIFPELDLMRIGCMGNSGGGTTTYYASCFDPRITAAMPSCYVCTFRHSIGRIDHCADNYLPGALRYLEMEDFAGLIAPRPLVVVAGREDPIFPLAGVEEAFTTIQAIYAAAGAPDNCRLVIGEGGHRFYPEEGWPAFRALARW
ncbi:MAG: alpha/beta hydrolase family protein [Armatimonadota bacterium]